MYFYDPKIPETLKCIESPEEATKYVDSIFNISDQLLHIKKNYYSEIYLPLNKNIFNQKTFKIVEEVIEYSIQTNNTDILSIMDTFIYALFFDESNLEYLFNSNYIIWCSNVYDQILEFDEYIEKHKKRKIDPRFYTDRDLEWFYCNYDLLRNVPYKDISVKNTDIKDYMFKNKAFMKFLNNVDYNIVYKNIINDTNGIEKFRFLLESL